MLIMPSERPPQKHYRKTIAFASAFQSETNKNNNRNVVEFNENIIECRRGKKGTEYNIFFIRLENPFMINFIRKQTRCFISSIGLCLAARTFAYLFKINMFAILRQNERGEND